MGWFWNKEKRAEDTAATTTDVIPDAGDILVCSFIGKTEMTKTQALQIPTVKACVNMIGDIVSTVDFKLYKRTGEKIEEVEDQRMDLINKDTGDTLDGVQFKKALVVDSLLGKGGYAYINKDMNGIKSLHYVDEEVISFNINEDPIFKDYEIMVHGKRYHPFEFVTILKNTKNGYRSEPLAAESSAILSVAYNSIKYEENLVKTGGNKKGFLQSAKKISKEAMDALKAAFRNLYSNNNENVVVLNDGITFKEASNTSVEMELNDTKKANNIEICKIFNMPPSVLSGSATEEDRKALIDNCIIPVLHRMEIAFQRNMLTKDEKKEFFIAADTADLTKGDLEKRFKAYEIASKNGFIQIDEIRKKEKLPSLGLDFIKLGLQDVLYDPTNRTIYTPNTNMKTNLDDPADQDEDETAEKD